MENSENINEQNAINLDNGSVAFQGEQVNVNMEGTLIPDTILSSYKRNIENSRKYASFDPEFSNRDKLLVELSKEYKDPIRKNSKVKNEEAKINGIKELGINGLSEEEYNIFNFNVGLDNCELREYSYTSDNKNKEDKSPRTKVSSAWNWFGVGADSNITMNKISKKIRQYKDRLYGDVADKEVTVKMSDWWIKGITSAAAQFDTKNEGFSGEGVYKIFNNDGSKITFYKDGKALFSFNCLNENKSLHDSNDVTFFNNGDEYNISATLAFSKLYNTVAKDKYVQKFFRNGADNGIAPGKQYGDYFEELGDMMDNVNSYAKENLSLYKQVTEPISIPGEQIYALVNGAEQSGIGTTLDINYTKLLNEADDVKLARIKELYSRLKDGELADFSSSKGNIANLYIEAPQGDAFDFSGNQGENRKEVLNSELRSKIYTVIKERFKDCQFVAIHKGTHWGYEITVPIESNEKKSILGLKNREYTVFIEGAMDRDVFNVLRNMPENKAKDMINTSIIKNNPYDYTFCSGPITFDYVNTYIDNDGDRDKNRYSVNEDANFMGSYNVYYNKEKGEMQYNWRTTDGRYIDLNKEFKDIFSGDSKITPGKCLEQYLSTLITLDRHINDLTRLTFKSNFEEYGKKLLDLANDENANSLNNFLNRKNSDTGLTNSQILAIFRNPTQDNILDIVRKDFQKSGQAKTDWARDDAYRAINAYVRPLKK